MKPLHDSLIVGLGELLWDELPSGAQLGGAPANFAYHASQLGHKAAVISAVGNDALGFKAIETLTARGIEVIANRPDRHTGTVGVHLNAQGVPEYDIRSDVAWDHIEATTDALHAMHQASAVCWGTLAQREAKSREAIMQLVAEAPKSALRICDVNLRQQFYCAQVITDSLRMCDIIKINDDELRLLQQMGIAPAGEQVAAAREMARTFGSRLVILTCGAECSYAIGADGTTSQLATPKVAVADTVGAGDSFTAAFCAATLCGAAPGKAHRLAVEVSAYVCTCHGAMPQLTQELTDKFLF